MTMNPGLLWFVCYILHSDWSSLLLVNIHGSFHCKQGMLLVLGNIILQHSVVYETESTTSCQYMEIIPTCYHRWRIYVIVIAQYQGLKQTRFEGVA